MEINPFTSFDRLLFGETRQSVRERLGNGYRVFRKDVGENETDAYDELGLHLYFDDQHRLEFVEAFEPASPTFCGIRLLGRDRDEVATEIAAMGHSVEQDDYGVSFYEAGFVLTAPRGIVEGVGIFRRGYYDT